MPEQTDVPMLEESPLVVGSIPRRRAGSVLPAPASDHAAADQDQLEQTHVIGTGPGFWEPVRGSHYSVHHVSAPRASRSRGELRRT